jgi:type 1 glutamine amidotransferase
VRSASALIAVVFLIAACGETTTAAPKPYRVLVFTKTTGYRHTSIDEGVAAIRALGRKHGFRVDTTADASTFTPARLTRYKAVVFVSTTGTPVSRPSQRAAFERYVRGGGGFVGIHAASDTRGKWVWYERLVGARFKHHEPGTPSRTVTVEDRTSAATRELPEQWTRADEWYTFRTDPRRRVHVLVSLDGAPLAWCHRYNGGRSVYTAMGHTEASFSEPHYLAHLLGTIQMAAGRAPFGCAP